MLRVVRMVLLRVQLLNVRLRQALMRKGVLNGDLQARVGWERRVDDTA